MRQKRPTRPATPTLLDAHGAGPWCGVRAGVGNEAGHAEQATGERPSGESSHFDKLSWSDQRCIIFGGVRVPADASRDQVWSYETGGFKPMPASDGRTKGRRHPGNQNRPRVVQPTKRPAARHKVKPGGAGNKARRNMSETCKHTSPDWRPTRHPSLHFLLAAGGKLQPRVRRARRHHTLARPFACVAQHGRSRSFMI